MYAQNSILCQFGPRNLSSVQQLISPSILVHFWWELYHYNLSDMLSKHLDHPTVYPMILKLLITRGNLTLIPTAATQDKVKEILKSQPEELKKKEKEKEKYEIKLINTPTTRGE